MDYRPLVEAGACGLAAASRRRWWCMRLFGHPGHVGAAVRRRPALATTSSHGVSCKQSQAQLSSLTQQPLLQHVA